MLAKTPVWSLDWLIVAAIVLASEPAAKEKTCDPFEPVICICTALAKPPPWLAPPCMLLAALPATVVKASSVSPAPPTSPKSPPAVGSTMSVPGVLPASVSEATAVKGVKLLIAVAMSSCFVAVVSLTLTMISLAEAL